jgi:cytochrome bd-type quinol oxidase subunit 2
VLTKLFGVAVACLLAGRLFAPKKSELARRFRIFVDVCLVLVFVMYGANLLQMWI